VLNLIPSPTVLLSKVLSSVPGIGQITFCCLDGHALGMRKESVLCKSVYLTSVRVGGNAERSVSEGYISVTLSAQLETPPF
jgi:hypothetical protein